MSIENKVKEWFFNIAVAKAIKSAAKLIVSWCAAKGVIFVANFGGITIDTGNEAALVIALNSLLTIVRNWAKVKFNIGWL